MDRNSVIGLVLIGLILIGFSILNAPSQEEIAAMKRSQDSIALVEKKEEAARKAAQELNPATSQVIPDSAEGNDSLKAAKLNDQLGAFGTAGTGTDSVIIAENDLMKLKLSTHGGRIRSVELKKYKTWDGKPLILFDSDSTRFGFNFFAQNRSISTNDLYFTAVGSGFKVSGADSNSISLRAFAGSPDSYIEYVYSLRGDKYLLGYKVNFVGLNNVIAANTNYLELNWQQQLTCKEKDVKSERANSTVYYMYADKDEEVDYLSETKDVQEDLKTKVKWVSMKQHFFTQVLIADKTFDKPTKLTSSNGTEEDNVVKNITASFTVPYQHTASESFGMQFYFGPNHYQTLKKTGYHLEKQIPLGWGIFGMVNRYLVIPVFNFLNSFDWNYGLIIFILTIIIKLILTPFTYKSYLSQAKMKVLKPEVEEIQGKFKEEPLKLQQEMMALYKKAGVSPLGGCLPMLLQLPILIAMFRFFPQSIELRQESFLWAKDLSTYDSILDLPFHIPFYGSHVSLWTLLMTISTVLITMVNSQSTAANPQMKMMLYLMPVFTLGIFNSYSAGLSYYYFLANVISIGQQYLFRSFVDDDAIHRQIQENKKRPQSQKKSKFQQRLEQMAKEKGYKLPK